MDAIGAFVDRRDACVTKVLRRTGFFDEAHAAVDLHAERRDLVADVCGESFRDRRQQRSARCRIATNFGIAGTHGNVERNGGGVANGTGRRGHCAHL